MADEGLGRDRSGELPDTVLRQLPTLSPEQRALFDQGYERRRKAGFWSWFTWFIGWHFAYIERRWGLNVFYFLTIALWFGLIWWLYEGILRVRGRLEDQRGEAAFAVFDEVVRSSPGR